VYGFQYLNFLKHSLSAVCFCCSSRRIWLCWDVLYFLYINTLLYIEHNEHVSPENYSCRQVSSV